MTKNICVTCTKNISCNKYPHCKEWCLYQRLLSNTIILTFTNANCVDTDVVVVHFWTMDIDKGVHFRPVIKMRGYFIKSGRATSTWHNFYDWWTYNRDKKGTRPIRRAPVSDWNTVYPKKYAHGFVVLGFVVVMQSFIMNSHEVFNHIHQGCFAGTGAIVRLPQCQWSKPDGYGKINQCITTTKHNKAKTVCIFLGIYCSPCCKL